MRISQLKRVALLATLGALALPATAFGAAQIQERPDGLADFDSRSGAVAPSAVQRAAVKQLKAKVSWNQFGTPASLSRQGKFLAKGVHGKNAAVAAEGWLNRHKTLFGLRSTDQLALVGDTRMTSSRGHAVNFRQVVNGLQTTEGGLVTIGITGSAKSGWGVAYVSSSLTRDSALDGRAKLSAEEAWVAGRAFGRRERVGARGPVGEVRQGVEKPRRLRHDRPSEGEAGRVPDGSRRHRAGVRDHGPQDQGLVCVQADHRRPHGRRAGPREPRRQRR